MANSDPGDESLEAWDAHGPPAQPPNREPGTRLHPHASRPRRDLEDRASVDGQEEEGREHLYGHRTLDGQAGRPHYLGNRARGHQAQNRGSDGAGDDEEPVEPEDATSLPEAPGPRTEARPDPS